MRPIIEDIIEKENTHYLPQNDLCSYPIDKKKSYDLTSRLGEPNTHINAYRYKNRKSDWFLPQNFESLNTSFFDSFFLLVMECI